MATTQQGKVTDFFSARKRSATNPSKRRKVEIRANETVFAPIEVTNTQQARSLPTTEDKGPASEKCENAVFSPLQTRAARQANASKVQSSNKKPGTRRRKGQVSDPTQKLISDILAGQKEIAPTITDAVTSSWDEHDAVQTPTKSTTASETKSRKRTRGQTLPENDAKEVTPEKRTQTNQTSKVDRKSKKKLELLQEKTVDMHNTENVEDLVIPRSPPPVSPLPPTPEPTVKTKPEVKMSAAVQAAMNKCKTLSTASKKKQTGTSKGEDIKEKLSKVTNLDDLKARLSQMKETKEKLKAPVPALKKFDKIKIDVEVPSDIKPAVPAYEKFHHLATPSAPTLNLPYKYKLLVEQFRGMDTVISMLHNRNEVCTFSKLKVAVQELTKRNFEMTHVGKIKTVYPDAYQHRQERGLKNSAGFKQTGYQLTVEARLEEEAEKSARPTFKASHLLRRKENFHNSLIHTVKQHHKEFLSKLSRPLTIPDDKITRWHPKFPLDEVPDISESPLPQAPDVQTYQTAKDVLNHARGRVAPKVENALISTAKEMEKNTPKPEIVPKPVSKPVTGALKGIPQSLLEKIRAREAANTVSSLIRDPKEEKRNAMLQRLPDIMRIVRSQFITEKKPSLTQESIITRIMDSSRSEMPAGDIQSHLDLCLELLPEWITIIQIKKGKYVKIDRNIELQVLTDKINNILKGKK